MGALHDGHAQLMRECRSLIGEDGLLVVSIFVNPTQFSDPSDLEKYPRTLEADLDLCSRNSVDVVFAPSVEEMTPENLDLPQFSAGALGLTLEGESRPGHFDAVATVVHRLISITEPDVSCFGEKDYQQVAVVRQMIAEAKLDVEIVGVPTVRESDGLAMSSRNVRLSTAERTIASVIPRSLEACRLAAIHGVEAAVAAGLEVLATEPAVSVDYFAIRATDLGEPPAMGEARALVAVNLGSVRLIDNGPIVLGSAL
jgi:pantoate--beta-alanine ligase